MTNYTMNNEKKAIDELDFDDLESVSGGGMKHIIQKGIDIL